MKKTFRKPYQIKKKKSLFRNRFFWLGILVLIIVIGIFYLVYFSSFFQIREIEITGNQKVLTKDLQTIIQNQIGQRILIFASKSIFSVNLIRIEEELFKNFPPISKIDLKRNFPDGLTIQIEERKPLAIFCRGEDYFFLDKTGIIFEEAPEINNQYLKIEDLTLTADLKLGDKVIEEEKLNQILNIESRLKVDLKTPLIAVIMFSEERLNVETLDGWEIYLNPQEDIEWQLTKLSAVLEEEIPSENRNDLEYIDLRFENLAPYKYQDY